MLVKKLRIKYRRLYVLNKKSSKLNGLFRLSIYNNYSFLKVCSFLKRQGRNDMNLLFFKGLSYFKQYATSMVRKVLVRFRFKYKGWNNYLHRRFYKKIIFFDAALNKQILGYFFSLFRFDILRKRIGGKKKKKKYLGVARIKNLLKVLFFTGFLRHCFKGLMNFFTKIIFIGYNSFIAVVRRYVIKKKEIYNINKNGSLNSVGDIFFYKRSNLKKIYSGILNIVLKSLLFLKIKPFGRLTIFSKEDLKSRRLDIKRRLKKRAEFKESHSKSMKFKFYRLKKALFSKKNIRVNLFNFWKKNKENVNIYLLKYKNKRIRIKSSYKNTSLYQYKPAYVKPSKVKKKKKVSHFSLDKMFSQLMHSFKPVYAIDLITRGRSIFKVPYLIIKRSAQFKLLLRWWSYFMSNKHNQQRQALHRCRAELVDFFLLRSKLYIVLYALNKMIADNKAFKHYRWW